MYVSSNLFKSLQLVTKKLLRSAIGLESIGQYDMATRSCNPPKKNGFS